MAISIAVIGGGIGGVSAALNLLRAGFDVHVYEQSPALREVGAGIQVSPNASRIVQHLGLGEELANIGVCPLAFHQRRWEDGRTLLKSPLGNAVLEAFGFPYYQVHRGDLLTILIGALPAERLHLGHKLTAFEDRGDRVNLQFGNGARADADLLIGADGIHSTVRRALFGEEKPRYSGGIAISRSHPRRARASPRHRSRDTNLDGSARPRRRLFRPRQTLCQFRRQCRP